LLVAKNEEAIAEGINPKQGNLECCTRLKTEALRNFVEVSGFDALILAIRRDEHGIRAKERYFSPRDEDFKWDYKDLAMRAQRSFSLEFKALNYVEAIYSRHKLVQL